MTNKPVAVFFYIR